MHSLSDTRTHSTASMAPPQERILYFKRYRMEITLSDLPPVEIPSHCRWLPWDRSLVDIHGEVLFGCFYKQIDSIVFSSLSDLPGCRALISDLSQRIDFLPQATWLLVWGEICCGTIQGLHDYGSRGAIQNVGILPGYQGHGLGKALVLQALRGFQSTGLQRVTLEVTAENERALGLYRRLGFRKIKTLYKSVVRKTPAASPALEPLRIDLWSQGS